MVSMKRLALIGIAVLLLVTVFAAGRSRAADKPTVVETYEVTVNDVGDAHVTDTIKYSKTDFAAIKKVGAKKRGFLTRRFTDEDATGELRDFKTQMNDKTNSVVITYDKLGLAYNTKGDFLLYGYSAKPTKQAANTFTFEETSTVNSEFTLFTDQVFKTTSILKIPPAASKASYDAQEKAVSYQMPPARTTYGFFSEQKTTLSIAFGLAALVFAGLLVFVGTKKPTEPVPVPVATPGPVPPAPVEPAHKFCQQCGAKVEPGKHFCTSCGAKVD